MTSFEKHLPAEQWQQVLANVSHGDLCNVMLTSRYMNSVASWTELWAGMRVNMGKARKNGLAQLYSINRFKKVKQMSFEGMELNNMEVYRLVADIPGSPLENINFALNKLSAVSPELLASAVKSLITVNLSFTCLTTNQCIKVLEAILSSSTLVDLDLGDVNLSGVPPNILASAVKRLKTIKLTNTLLTTDQCIKILEDILSITLLVDLDLSFVNLREVPPNLLVSAVKRLNTVNLSVTNLTPNQCIKVLEAILSSSTLVDLDLGDVDLSGVPPNILATAVKRLKTIKLTNTQLAIEQCIKVLEAILSSTTLVDLDLEYVKLCGVPPNVLASAVKRLNTVNLSRTYLITEQCIKVLETSLFSITLVDLDLGDVDLSGVPPNLLASAVKRLNTVNLSRTHLTTDQCIKVLEASLYSKTLVDLDLRHVNLSRVPPNLLESSVKRLNTVNLSTTFLTADQRVKLTCSIFSSHCKLMS